MVDVRDGREVAAGVYNYRSGEAGIVARSKDPNWARQNPADYIEGFTQSVGKVVQKRRRRRTSGLSSVWALASTPQIDADARGSTRHTLGLYPSFAIIWQPTPGYGKTTRDFAEAAETHGQG